MDKQDQGTHELPPHKTIAEWQDMVKKVLEKYGIIYVENHKYIKPPSDPKQSN